MHSYSQAPHVNVSYSNVCMHLSSIPFRYPYLLLPSNISDENKTWKEGKDIQNY